MVREGILGRFVLLVPEELVEEPAHRVSDKPYRAERIHPHDLEALLSILRETAELLPQIPNPIPAVRRDPKDDCLIARAVLARADSLVTGDKDLLSLERLDRVRGLTPRSFWEVLQGNEPPASA